MILQAPQEHPLVTAVRLRNRARKAKAHPAIIARLEAQADAIAKLTAARIGEYCRQIERESRD